MKKTLNTLFNIVSAVVMLTGVQAQAEEKTASDDALRAAVQNPISSLISLPFKFTFDYGATNGDASILSIQPVVPVTVGNWNLVNRAIIPVIDSPGPVAGIPSNPSPAPGNGETGLGDINYSVYFSPVDYGKVIWGVGPSITLKTATDDQLGSGKWSAGASAVALTQPSWGSVGILGRQLWSFAGDDNRQDVNQFLLEPFANYNLSNGWFLLTDMVMNANWDAPSGQVWTVPVGGGAGRVFKIGQQAVNSRLEAYYNVVNPDAAPDWSVSFTLQFLFPK